MTEPLRSLLDAHPLPPVGGDKRDRGSAVIVAGSARCPGAAILAATAALRAGVGRVQVVTSSPVATSIGIAVPESYVIGWELEHELPKDARERLADADAVVVGPGLDDDADSVARAVARHVHPSTPLLVDALALEAVPDLLAQRRILCMPNLDEAEHLATQLALASARGPDELARAIAARTGAPGAVRGETTILADASRAFCQRGAPSLGTAGSGDVLAGITVGLLARGLDHTLALGWAIASHAAAGDRLASGRPNPGYLARELVDALPAAFEALRSSPRSC